MTHIRTVHRTRTCARLACTLALAAVAATAQALTAQDVLADYTRQAGGAKGSVERGQTFFTTNFGKQMGWSCASCHTADPRQRGKDDMTEKRIEPLAPAVNAQRFTDKHKVENALRQNCKDVVGRECTAQEKVDVLTWLLSLKP